MCVPELTVIVPVYNEAKTIVPLLEAVGSAAFDKEIIVVDDGSSDNTVDTIERWRSTSCSAIDLVRHPTNRGKGAAIRTGLIHARGRAVIIQDADLEYDPRDYASIIRPILDGEVAVVYGSRYLRPANPLPWTPNRVCVVLLNLLVRLLYARRLSDEATCYKAFDVDLLRRLDLRCERFEFCPEVTAKLCRMGVEILEVPISYSPRTQVQGKKIRWFDGVEAIATLLRWRFQSFRPGERFEERPISPPPLICKSAPDRIL